MEWQVEGICEKASARLEVAIIAVFSVWIQTKWHYRFYLSKQMTVRRIHNQNEIIPIYSPRTTYKKIKSQDEKMIADMTLNFDKVTINLLKDEFQKKNNELNLEEFVVIAKRHLKFWQMDIPNRDFALMRYLTMLFVEIDINGNGDMEWEQFTNYIIEKATVLKNLKSKADEIKQYVKSPINPKIKIEGLIEKVEYIKDLDKVAFYEEGTNRIMFMSLDNGEVSSKPLIINPKKLVVNISSVKKEKNGKLAIRKKDLVIPTEVRVLDMLYLSEKKYRILLVSTSDGYVRGWKCSQSGYVLASQPDNEEEQFEHYFNAQIYCMAWDNINEILYCGQKNGNIYMWNLKTDLERVLNEWGNATCDKESFDERANMMITSMITMPKLQFMASGRIDGKLILWDTINNKKKWVYKEHTRGILTLTFNEAMILLFSAGFDHKICIWNPYIKSLIHKIQSHLSPILSLKVIEGTNQLISMDSQGIVKIVDTKRFNVINSFTVDHSSNTQTSSTCPFALSSFIAITNPLKLIFAGKTISVYEYDKHYSPTTADENVAICCRYVKDTLCFFTPVGNKIKVWSALNGDVEKIYMDITPGEISTFDFDYLKKRMIVGDTRGNVTLHNTANGAKMKSLSKHNGEITYLVGTQNDLGVDLFISSGLDNEIRISKETEESYEVIRTIFIRKDVEVTCLSFCRDTKLIIVGSNVGNLGFYDIETGKTVGTCLNKPDEEFTSICKAEQSFIIATTSLGRISFISMPPYPNRFQKLLSFFHKDCEKEEANLGVRTSCYSSKMNRIFVVDDKMYLTCYDLKEVIQGLENNSAHSLQKLETKRRASVSAVLDNVQIEKKWQIKVHTEIVKSLQYIEEEGVIVTTSFDKKVKIWDPDTGNFLDSLQQNYCKDEPSPLSFYNCKSHTLHTPDRRQTIPYVCMDPINLQYDPFAFEDIIKKEGCFEKHSNKDWSLNIDFRDIAVEQRKNFEGLQTRVNALEEAQLKANHLDQNAVNEIRKKLENQKRVLKQIRWEMKPRTMVHLKMKRGTSTAPYFDQKSSNTQNRNSRVSMLKGIKNLARNTTMKLGSSCEEEEYPKAKKVLDYTPIERLVMKNERSMEEIRKHKIFIDELAQRDTQSLINRRQHKKIHLSLSGATAANKLIRLLQNDVKDRKADLYVHPNELKENRYQSSRRVRPSFN